jgi:drug/metabolite transporter (DMT)-like permease
VKVGRRESRAEAGTREAVRPGAVAPGRRSYKLPIAALLLLALVWGYSWVVMKIALDYVQPWTFAAMRTVIGGVALLALLPLLKRPLKPKAPGPTAVLGVLQTTGFVGFLTWALEGGGAGKTSILTYTMPFWLLLLARVFLRERLKGFQWAAVGLALCGLVLVLTPWELTDGFSSFIAVGGALFWAASAVYAKILRSRHEVDLLSLTAWQMLFGAVPLIVIALATWTTAPQWPSVFIACLIYVAILGNALAWILWLYILNSFSAGTAGLATLLTPVIGISSAWIQLGEQPGVIEGLGMAAIVGALLLVALRGLLAGRGAPARRRDHPVR